MTVHALNVFGNGSKSEPVQVLIGKLLFLFIHDVFLLIHNIIDNFILGYECGCLVFVYVMFIIEQVV